MALYKSDQENFIVYQSGDVKVKLWKDALKLRYEIQAPWPVPGFANWEEYAAGIEEHETVVIPEDPIPMSLPKNKP